MTEVLVASIELHHQLSSDLPEHVVHPHECYRLGRPMCACVPVQVKPGSTVAVFGLGAVGLAVIERAKKVGCRHMGAELWVCSTCQ